MAEHEGSYVHDRDLLFPSQARPTFAQAISQDNQAPKNVIPKKANVTQTNSSGDKNRKRTIHKGDSPLRKKFVTSQPSLGETEKLQQQNRFNPLSDLNGNDPFNFTGLTEAMDHALEKASTTPADSKNSQENPHPNLLLPQVSTLSRYPPPRTLLLTPTQILSRINLPHHPLHPRLPFPQTSTKSRTLLPTKIKQTKLAHCSLKININL